MAGYVSQSRTVEGRRGGQVISVAGHGALDWSRTEKDIFPDSTYYNQRPLTPLQTTYSYRDSGQTQTVLDFGGDIAGSSLKRVKTLDRHRETNTDSGHVFDTKREFFYFEEHDLRKGDRYYRGPLIPVLSSSETYGNSENLQTSSSLEARGQVAIRDTIPTESPAGLAQALIELRREGLPSLLGLGILKDGLSPAKVGGEFLNLEFGIKPLLRDLQDTIEAVINSSELLAKYQDGAGKKQHRQRWFEPVRSIDTSIRQGQLVNTSGSSYALLTSNGKISCLYENYGRGTLTTTLDVVETDYFKGCYVYYLQKGDSPISKLHENAKQAEYLLGLELTPELLWEIGPWSWLADWVFNIGVNISNATALSEDGTVLQYGYMMRKSTVSRTHCLTELQVASGVEGAPSSISATTGFIRKQRIRATPYGFGLNPDTFSDRQWAILGALGLSRGNNSLRYSD